MSTIVVIPTHKSKLDGLDLESFDRALSVFTGRDICLACPESMDVSWYESKGIKHFERFDDEYFKTLLGYNRLVVESHFYARFSKYDYVLIYQTDAYVFYDDIDRWEEMGYDSIGAPWMAHIIDPNVGDLFHHVGNGGFAMRKVSSMVEALSKHADIVSKGVDLGIYEDVLLCIYLPQNGVKLNLPDYKTACEFAFETYPAACYGLTHKIPFGGHKLYVHGNDFFIALKNANNGK